MGVFEGWFSKVSVPLAFTIFDIDCRLNRGGDERTARGVTYSTFYPCKRADLGKSGRFCTFYPCTPCKYGLILRSADQKASNNGHFSMAVFKSIRAACVRIRAVGG